MLTHQYRVPGDYAGCHGDMPHYGVTSPVPYPINPSIHSGINLSLDKLIETNLTGQG